MRFEVLGQVRVFGPDEEVSLRGQVSPKLLGALLSRAGQPVPRHVLIDVLWPDEPPETAGELLKSYISRLRKELGEPSRVVHHRGRGAYRLVVAAGELDAADFIGEVEQSRQCPDQAEELLDRALSRWHGPPFGGLEDCEFVSDEQRRLEEWYVQAAVEWASLGLQRDRHAELLPRLQVWHQRYPVNERITELLMLALYRADRRQDALDVCAATRRHLRDEHGSDPGPSLGDLQVAILNSDPSLLQQPHTDVVRGTPHNGTPSATATPQRWSVSWLVERARRRPWMAAAAATVGLALVLGGGIGSAAAQQAMPGDALYGFKRSIESVATNVSVGDGSRGQRELGHAMARLAELRALNADGADAAILGKTLDDFSSQARKGVSRLVAAYQQDGEKASIETVHTFITEARRQLVELAPQLPDGASRSAIESVTTVDNLVAHARASCSKCGR